MAVAVVALLDNAPPGLASQITQPSSNPVDRELRKDIWTFTRDSATGLPSSSLVADSQWHSQLLSHIKTLLANLETNFGLKQAANLGNKLSKLRSDRAAAGRWTRIGRVWKKTARTWINPPA